MTGFAKLALSVQKFRAAIHRKKAKDKQSEGPRYVEPLNQKNKTKRKT
jgi:hypothetical protein